MRGIVPWCREVDVPEGVESADVHGEEAVGEECDEEVAGPDAAEGEDSSWSLVGGEVVC